jgi:hypothetical protein
MSIDGGNSMLSIKLRAPTRAVLGIARGCGKVQFGGPRGRTFLVKAGDIAILPAGTGHQFFPQQVATATVHADGERSVEATWLRITEPGRKALTPSSRGMREAGSTQLHSEQLRFVPRTCWPP